MNDILHTTAPEYCASHERSWSKCLSTMLQHRALVAEIFCDLEFIVHPVFSKYPTLFDGALASITTHDMDKTQMPVMKAFAAHFYPLRGEREDTDYYQSVRRRHAERSPHHSAYWEDDPQTICPRRVIATVEMACDWEATSEALGHSALRYYMDENTENPHLPPDIDEMFIALLTALQEYRLRYGVLVGKTVVELPEDVKSMACANASNLLGRCWVKSLE